MNELNSGLRINDLNANAADRALEAADPWDPFLAAADELTKRLMDVALSTLMFVGTAPLMMVIAILIKLDSKGPVFHTQVRVGKKKNSKPAGPEAQTEMNFGEPFHIVKFRSMVVDAEAKGAMWCQEKDPRVTAIGYLLRKTHLDELPQILNVLKGDMSFVGPRPERPEIVSRLIEKVPGYESRLELKPGITGLAQIRHRADLQLSDVKKKVRYDLLYKKKKNVFTDVKIMLGTIPLMLGFPAGWSKQMRSRVLNRLELN